MHTEIEVVSIKPFKDDPSSGLHSSFSSYYSMTLESMYYIYKYIFIYPSRELVHKLKGV